MGSMSRRVGELEKTTQQLQVKITEIEAAATGGTANGSDPQSRITRQNAAITEVKNDQSILTEKLFELIAIFKEQQSRIDQHDKDLKNKSDKRITKKK